jgi:hypothetical protein
MSSSSGSRKSASAVARISSTANSFVLASAAERVREMQAKKAAEKQAAERQAPASQLSSLSTNQRRRSSASSLAKAAAEAAEKAAADLELIEAQRLAEENERLEMEERMLADAKRKRTESNFLGSSQGPRGRRGSNVSVPGGNSSEISTASLQPSKRAPVTRTPPPAVQPIVRPQPVNAFANVQSAAVINASKALAAVERAKQAKAAAAAAAAASSASSAAAFMSAASASPSRSLSRRSSGVSAPARSTPPLTDIEQDTIVYEDPGLTMTQRKRRARKSYNQEDQAPTPPNIVSTEGAAPPQMPTPREVLRHLFDPPAASGGWTAHSSTLIGSLVGRGQQAALQFLSSSSSSSVAQVANVVPSPGILDLSHLGVVAPTLNTEASPTSGTRRGSFAKSRSSTNPKEASASGVEHKTSSSSGLRQRFGGPTSSDASSSFLFSPTTEKITKVQLANIEHRKGVKTYYMWISALLAIIILFYSFTYYLLPLYSRHERFEAIKSHLRQRYGAAECASPFGSSSDVFADKAKVSFSDIHTSFCGGGGGAAVDSPCDRAVKDVFSSSLLFVVESENKGGIVSMEDLDKPLKIEDLTVRAREGSWTLECRLQMIWGWLKSQISYHRRELMMLFISSCVIAIVSYRYMFQSKANEQQKEKSRQIIERLAKILADVAEERPYVPVPAGRSLMEFCIKNGIDEENHGEARSLFAEALHIAPQLYNVEVKGSGEGASIKFPRIQ